MRIKAEQLKNLKNLKVLPIIIILLLIAAISLRAYKPLWSKNISLNADIIRKTQEIAKSANLSSLKRTANSEINELDDKLSSIEKRFSTSNTEKIFSSLNRLIEASGISLKAISPLEKTEVAISGSSKDKYIELPISLKLECNYEQLLSFLNNIENANNIMLVTEVKIQSNPENIWEHNIELSLNIPMLLSPLKN